MTEQQQEKRRGLRDLRSIRRSIVRVEVRLTDLRNLQNEMIQELAISGVSAVELATNLGISDTAVRKILKNMAIDGELGNP